MASIHLSYEEFKSKTAELEVEHAEAPGFYLLISYGTRTEWQCRICKYSEEATQYLLDINANPP